MIEIAILFLQAGAEAANPQAPAALEAQTAECLSVGSLEGQVLTQYGLRCPDDVPEPELLQIYASVVASQLDLPLTVPPPSEARFGGANPV